MPAKKTVSWSVFLLVITLCEPLYGGEAQNAFNEAIKHHRAGRLKEAIAAYDRAIKADPKAAPAYLARGTAYARLGETYQASKDYDEALRLNPDFTDAYYYRGNAYAAAKQFQTAIKDYDEALKRNPK